jgi:hypothetical protein
MQVSFRCIKNTQKQKVFFRNPVLVTTKNIKSRRMRLAGHVARMGRRGMHMDIGGKSRRKETSRKTRRRWVDNIKMDLREIGLDGMDWIDLAQDRDQWRALVNAVMNLRVL